MELSAATLRPGKVIEVIENGYGKIKAHVPGLFTAEDKDLNPPIMPFFEIQGPHANQFSMPNVDDTVWVLNLYDNPRQLYWFRKDNHKVNNEAIFSEDGATNVEILCHRKIGEGGSGHAILYFSDGSGWILRRDNSRLQIFPDGHIELGMEDPKRVVTIDNEAIKLGGVDHPGCFADKTKERLDEICNLLLNAAKAAQSNPYTMSLTPVFNKAQQILDKTQEIVSDHVKLTAN